MSLTQTQVDQAFAALGQPAPSGALLASIMAITDDYAALNAIIALPQVQSADIPIVSMFDLALGHDPSAATLSSMVSGGASLAATASAFVASQSFANVYNAGVLLNPNTIVSSANNSIITALFLNGLGHAPTPATLADFNGLTLAQAFLDFTTSSTVAVSATVNASILQILELATGVPATVNPTPTQSFTLTNGSDSVIGGHNTVGTTAPGTLVIQSTAASPEDTVINAPLSGPFGNQHTLTSGDVINLSASVDGANSLIAGFDGGANVTGVTIQGVQTWTINQAGGGSVFIEGIPGAIDGLTSLTFNGNGLNAENLQVGISGAGIDRTTPADGFTLNVSNVASNPVTGIVTVFFDPKSFNPAGGDTLNLNVNAVTNTQGNTVGSHNAALFIEAGSGGTAGFANWVVNSTGANALNDIALSALGSQAATSLTVTDDGSATKIWAVGNGSDFANLTTINALGTSGQLTITGNESTDGLLSQATLITTVLGGSGADLFDLTALTGGGNVSGIQISGGGNTTGTNGLGDIGTGVELSSSEITSITTAFNWSGVNILYDVANNTVGGTVDMADFSGTNILTLLNPGSGTTNIAQGSDLDVKDGQAGLVINTNHLHQNGHNFEVDAAAGLAAGDTVTVNYGDNGGGFAAGSTGQFTSIGYDNVDVNVSDINSGLFYAGGFTAVANGTGAEHVTIDTSVTIDIGSGLGGDHIGTSSLTLLGGTLIDPTSGTLTLDTSDGALAFIGVTNANVINGGNIVMEAPDNDITVTGLTGHTPYAGVNVDATGNDVLLQGSMGAVSTVPNPDTGEGIGATTHTGEVGNDDLTDLAGGTNHVLGGGANLFSGDGGQDAINLGGGDNIVMFGSYRLDFANHAIAITNTHDNAFQGFWDVGNDAGKGGIIGAGDSTSADMTTINGFTMQGSHNDILNFDADAWGGGGNGGSSGTGQLENGGGLQINNGVDGDAVMQLVGAGSTIAANTTFVLYTVGGLTNASDLAAALSGVGAVKFAGGPGGYDNGAHMLVAYDVGNDIHIADVDFVNSVLTVGPNAFSTAGRTIVASDIADLVGGNNGVTASLAILGINQHDVHFQFAA